MLSYFTELNRKRVPPQPLDFISHCTNPIVHAADDLSVMQTLEALPFITRSVRAIYGNKRYRIGPSTIPMRQNPYGSRTMDNPDGVRMPMANSDPRHNGLFAEAFAFGYAAKVLDADLECLTLSALTGQFGLLAGPSGARRRGCPAPPFQGRENPRQARWLRMGRMHVIEFLADPGVHHDCADRYDFVDGQRDEQRATGRPRAVPPR